MKQNLKPALSTALVIASTLAIEAQAALPTSVATTFTEMSDNINDIFDLAFPIVALGLGLTVVIKLFKRFGNKV